MMWVIAIDRIFCVAAPFRYPQFATRKKMSVSIISIWVVSIILGSIRGVNLSVLYAKVHQLLGFSVALSYASFAISTYGVILWKIRQSRIKSHHETEKKLKFRKEYLVPCIIISTYICFYIIPKLVHSFYLSKNANPSLVSLSILLPKIGLLTDPIVYLFLSKHYRDCITRHCIRVSPKHCGKVKIKTESYEPEFSR